MKRILFSLLAVFCLTACSDLDSDKIYFFTKPNCPYCQRAEAYIKEKHPNLKVEYKNVNIQRNRVLFSQCARKFDIPQSQLGTPLICMGDNVLLGWSEKHRVKFEEIIKNFK